MCLTPQFKMILIRSRRRDPSGLSPTHSSDEALRLLPISAICQATDKPEEQLTGVRVLGYGIESVKYQQATFPPF